MPVNRYEESIPPFIKTLNRQAGLIRQYSLLLTSFEKPSAVSGAGRLAVFMQRGLDLQKSITCTDVLISLYRSQIPSERYRDSPEFLQALADLQTARTECARQIDISRDFFAGRKDHLAGLLSRSQLNRLPRRKTLNYNTSKLIDVSA